VILSCSKVSLALLCCDDCLYNLEAFSLLFSVHALTLVLYSKAVKNVHVKHLYKQILLRSALHRAGEARALARC